MSHTRQQQPLWICPRCNRRFANQNQSHACGQYTLESHFVGKDPMVVSIFHRFSQLVQEVGPVVILPEKTRIAFQVRMSFAAVMLRQHWMDGHVVLARKLASPRFRRIDDISPRNQVHCFRLVAPEEVDEEVAQWVKEAYRVGEQRHLDSTSERSTAESGSFGC